MENKYDFNGLAKYLLNRVRELMVEWLPGGRLIGQEYTCGDLRGGQGDSCKVNIQTGMWADFAATESGGDLISLYATIYGYKNGEAAQELIEKYNYTSNNTPVSVPEVPSEAIIPPPEGTYIPTMSHYKYGLPTEFWEYRNLNNDLLYYMARYDHADGKEFLPWVWNGHKFISKAYPAPRPLYGLQYLGDKKKPILIVEGERAADAARRVLGDIYIVITWSNGSKAFNKTDWSPIYGYKILIWPDMDNPGRHAAVEIAKLLKSYCEQIKIVEVKR